MTPSELKMMIDVFQEKQKIEAEKDLLNAYMTAYFQRVDKLEQFETYRKRLDKAEDSQKQMSNEDMLKKVMELNAMMNGANNQQGG